MIGPQDRNNEQPPIYENSDQARLPLLDRIPPCCANRVHDPRVGPAKDEEWIAVAIYYEWVAAAIYYGAIFMGVFVECLGLAVVGSAHCSASVPLLRYTALASVAAGVVVAASTFNSRVGFPLFCIVSIACCPAGYLVSKNRRE
jgi:hypothetical protein